MTAASIAKHPATRARTRKPRTRRANLPRLVVADDDALVRSMLPLQLEHVFQCVGAGADAREAILLVARHRPDLAILDVDMPCGGAICATREISAGSPETAIVILSGDETRTGVIALIEAGAIAYLRKGVDPRDLACHLTAAITAHRNAAPGRGASQEP